MVKLVSKENLEYYTLRVKNKFSEIRDDLDKFKTKATTYEKVTYAELVTKRQNRQLTAGGMYRIVDYETTVANDEEARSAGHVFDLILRAISSDTLSEEAYAIQSERDTDGYFSDANLNAWQVWYCLDNDTTRFQWADEENGKGVIYRLIDEWQNDCPYDFKNVQFKRYRCNAINENLEPAYCGFENMDSADYELDMEDSIWAYTFSLITWEDNDYTTMVVQNLEDASLKIRPDMDFDVNDDKTLPNCYNYHNFCEKNSIQSFSTSILIDEAYHYIRVLNNIVMYVWLEMNDYDNEIYSIHFMHNNLFGINCANITMGNECYSNIFGYGCKSIIVGNIFYLNTFGNYCSSNSFGNGCSGNSFGNYCSRNSFGNGFIGNTFGNDFSINSFGNGCSSNSFGNYCSRNSFGNSCEGNTFGNSCGGNTFGNDCSCNSFVHDCNWNTFGCYCWNNSFGNSCRDNTFGNGCRRNTFGNKVRQLTVFEEVQYVSVTGIESGSSYIQNAQILNGTRGTNGLNMLQISFQENAIFCQIAGLKSDGSLRIWNPADGA